ncbi:MAG: protein kinase domain-containing protein [Terriglobia bacterium]
MIFTERQIINGRYRIGDKAGEGDLGPVYRAFDEIEPSRPALALRPITLPHASDAENLAEADRQIVALNEPDVAPPGTIEKTPEGQFFLVRGFIEGVTLAQLISEHAPLPLSRSCSLALRIAAALEPVHHAGLIHGNLKPANILVTHEKGEEGVKVLGLGTLSLKKDHFISLARLAVGVDGQPLFGTPEYLSPDQALGTSPEALDGRSDLYALGVILYQMLTGELPHRGGSPMDVLLAQIFTEAGSLAARTDVEVPLAVDTLLMRMLAKKRTDRPASATAVVDQLGAWEERPSRRKRPAAPEPLLAPPFPAGLDVAREIERPTVVSPPPPPAPLRPAMAPPVISSPPPPSVAPSAVPETRVGFVPLSPRPEARTAGEGGPSLEKPAERAGGEALGPREMPEQLTPAPESPPRTLPHDGFVADLPAAAAGVPLAATRPREAAPVPLDIRLNRGAPAAPLEPQKPIRQGATRGSVLFREHPPRGVKRGHRVLKGFGIAAIVLIILVGGTCGWLYATGRTYWFDKDFIKTQISYYLTSGTPANAPETEKVSQPVEGTPPAPVTKPQSKPAQLAAQSPSTPPASSISQRPAPAVRHPAEIEEAAPPTPLGEQHAATASQTPTAAPNTRSTEGASTASRRDARAEAAAVQDAVTRGQYYFERGDYDAAIQVYQRTLARFPADSELLARIQQAKRAKAAEAKYLQQ